MTEIEKLIREYDAIGEWLKGLDELSQRRALRELADLVWDAEYPPQRDLHHHFGGCGWHVFYRDEEGKVFVSNVRGRDEEEARIRAERRLNEPETYGPVAVELLELVPARSCRKCGHIACPFCVTWCDSLGCVCWEGMICELEPSGAEGKRLDMLIGEATGRWSATE